MVLGFKPGLGDNDPDFLEKIGRWVPRYSPIGDSEDAQKPDLGVIWQLFKRKICRGKTGPFLGTLRILRVQNGPFNNPSPNNPHIPRCGFPEYGPIPGGLFSIP